MNKLRIGILGGTRGIDFMTNDLMNHPYARVAAICENYVPLKEKLENQVKDICGGISVFTEYDEFLDSGLDAVIIANFANEHAPYAIKALNKGIHVFCESLPTQTLKEAVELCEAVENSGKLYVYGENYCYLPHMLEIRRILDSGVMGEIMHAEANFINDCSMKWHLLTRGDRNHWRNHVPSTFYCTHSIGPILFSSGRRAVNVVGMETQRMPHMAKVGARSGSAAMEIMQLDNGGMAKSCNGNYRREYNAEYRFICENGTVEADPYSFGTIQVYTANEGSKSYDRNSYQLPYVFDGFEIPKQADQKNLFAGANTYMINAFIQAILGNEDAKKYVIDVYRALDMSLPGLLAYRSILNGSNAVKVPDFRNKEDRELYRNDNCSTDASVSSGDELLPSNRSGFVDVEDEVYERVSDAFKNTPITTGGH